MPTLASAPLKRPVNRSILNQHVEDTSFCWLRRQEALWRPSYRSPHQQRLDQLLDAHLEGLRIASSASLPIALNNLKRWETADEMFTSTYIMLQQDGEVDWEPLETILKECPSSSHGATAALLWNTTESTYACLKRWTNSTEPSLRAAATSAIAIRHANGSLESRTAWVLERLEDPSNAARARALRCIGEWNLSSLARYLHTAATDNDPLCRFESAYAMTWLRMEQGGSTLLETLPLMTGTKKRRGLLVLALTATTNDFNQWLHSIENQPDSQRDMIWALAFRGDNYALDRLLKLIQIPAYSRLTAYAICHITGLDLDEQGLWHPDAQNDPEASYFSEDDGLLIPDPKLLAAWVKRIQTTIPKSTCWLAGKAMTLENAKTVLQTGWQPQRWQAAFIIDLHQHHAQSLLKMSSPRL